MSSLQRRVGMLILIALVIQPLATFAQQDNAVSVVGSGIAAPLIQAYAATANVTIDLNVNGTNAGFSALCNGSADITAATRSISIDEQNACQQNGVSFLEFVLGYDIMAVVANPTTDFGQCLTTDQLNTLFAPSSTATNWNQVGVGNADIPLSLYVPADNTTPFALLDSVVEGVGLRNDVNTLDGDSAIIDAVSSTDGALGIVNLSDAQAAGDKVSILQLNTTSTGCAAPSADAVQGRSYTAAYTLFAYANSAQIDAMQPLFAAAFDPQNASTITSQGFFAPTADVYSTDSDILQNVKTGRQFSKDVTAFTIPQNLVGTITVAGAATGSDYLKAATTAFTQQYAAVTINSTFSGEPDGIRKLCNGEADMVLTYNDLTAEQQQNCTANNIPTDTITLGSDSVVLLGSGDFMTCLTTDQVTTAWRATSEKTITNWNQVDASFPDLPITLVAPAVGDPLADILMLTASGQPLTTREDFAETKASPSYRIAAVGNVEGGMTYMNWLDYQALTADDQARAQLVAVDAGSGCVAPSAETLADGTYPLSRPLNLIVNHLAMARQEVQSLLWYLASDANYTLLSSNGFTGIPFANLPDLRERLQTTYVQAANDAAEAAVRAAQATPEATSEATPESTPAS